MSCSDSDEKIPDDNPCWTDAGGVMPPVRDSQAHQRSPVRQATSERGNAASAVRLRTSATSPGRVAVAISRRAARRYALACQDLNARTAIHRRTIRRSVRTTHHPNASGHQDTGGGVTMSRKFSRLAVSGFIRILLQKATKVTKNYQMILLPIPSFRSLPSVKSSVPRHR